MGAVPGAGDRRRRVGMTEPVDTASGRGAVKWTEIVVSEATPVVPLAGETPATAKGCVTLAPAVAAPVVVVPAPEVGEPVRLLAYQVPPAASASTTTAVDTHGQTRRRRGP